MAFCDDPAPPAVVPPAMPQVNRNWGPTPGFTPVAFLPAQTELVRSVTVVQECCPAPAPDPVAAVTTGWSGTICPGITFANGLLQNWAANAQPAVTFTSLDDSVHIAQSGCAIDLQVTLPANAIPTGVTQNKCGFQFTDGLLKAWGAPIVAIHFDAATGLVAGAYDPNTCTLSVAAAAAGPPSAADTSDVLYTHFTCCVCTSGALHGRGPVISWVVQVGNQFRVLICDDRAAAPAGDFATLTLAKDWMKQLSCTEICGNLPGP